MKTFDIIFLTLYFGVCVLTKWWTKFEPISLTVVLAGGHYLYLGIKNFQADRPVYQSLTFNSLQVIATLTISLTIFLRLNGFSSITLATLNIFQICFGFVVYDTIAAICSWRMEKFYERDTASKRVDEQWAVERSGAHSIGSVRAIFSLLYSRRPLANLL